MTLDLIDTRPAVDDDRAFIFATWLRGLYYGDSWFSLMVKNEFMKEYHNIIEHILNHPKTSIQVACLKEDPSVILGYAVLGPARQGAPTAHWVFVKAAWRRIGIAKLLVPADTKTVTHLTTVGLSIIRKRPEIQFNPFALK